MQPVSSDGIVFQSGSVFQVVHFHCAASSRICKDLLGCAILSVCLGTLNHNGNGHPHSSLQTEELHGKACKDCVAEGKTGSAVARNGGSQHDVHGRSGTDPQTAGASCGLPDATGDDPSRQADGQ